MDIFKSIFERIDDVIINNIAGGTANLLNIVAPLIQAVFIIYVMFIVFSYWQNGASIEGMFFDTLKRVAAIGVIIGFSVNLSGYNDAVLPIVLGLGDGLSQAFTGSPTSNASSLDALAGQIADIVNANADAAWEAEGIAEKVALVIETTLNNAVILITSSIFLVIAAAYIILVKVFLAILAVLGPIFISLLLFPASRQYGMNWINQVLNYSLLTLLINIAGGFFINYVNNVLNDMTASSTGATTGAGVVLDGVIGTTGVTQIVLATLLFVIILWKLPELSSGLAGGITAGGGFSQMMNMARMGKQFFGKSGGGKNTGGSVKPEKSGK